MLLATPTNSSYSPSAPAHPSPPAATDSKIALWIICLLFGLVVLCIIIEQFKGMDPLANIYYIGLAFGEVRRAWRYAILETLLETIDPTLPILLRTRSRDGVPQHAS
ncbi:hypothetical protein PENSPDRAFT_688327 [Peniophora sp. CONT]|nr:hypothetical protein PENSPDRAFT_688327 [Peniophora sp. CONT]